MEQKPYHLSYWHGGQAHDGQVVTWQGRELQRKSKEPKVPENGQHSKEGDKKEKLCLSSERWADPQNLWLLSFQGLDWDLKLGKF